MKEHLTYTSLLLSSPENTKYTSETKYFMVDEGWGERPK